MTVPRILIGGTHSGCGKTTLTIALIKALKDKGLHVKSFKCGPDYIDPMFHRKALDSSAGNLDIFMTGENTVKYLLDKDSQGFDICVMEGVMGFYDGLGGNSQISSANHLSLLTETPAVIVIDCKGMSLSVIALLKGYLEFSDNKIKGVIFNRCSPKIYEILKKETEDKFDIKVLGYMPVTKDCSLESRHLGLVTAEEIGNIKEIIDTLGEKAAETIDIAGLMALAETAGEVNYEEIPLKKVSERPRIAVAHDKAFCFYYSENFDLIREIGGEIVFFSPIKDGKLPEDISGLYFGGGYPEVYIKELSENESMKKSVREAIRLRMPCIAECGGYMYLTEAIDANEMAGVIKGSSYMTKSLKRFGYITLKAEKDNLLCRKGEEINAHEFHYSDSDFNGESFTAYKANGTKYRCIHADEDLFAGYPHINFWANPGFLYNYLLKAVEFKKKGRK